MLNCSKISQLFFPINVFISHMQCLSIFYLHCYHTSTDHYRNALKWLNIKNKIHYTAILNVKIQNVHFIWTIFPSLRRFSFLIINKGDRELAVIISIIENIFFAQ